MRKLIAASLLSFLLTGCIDTPDYLNWEFQTFVPIEASPSALVELEIKLRQEGYSQFVFRKQMKVGFFTVIVVGTTIYATRQQPKTRKINNGKRDNKIP